MSISDHSSLQSSAAWPADLAAVIELCAPKLRTSLLLMLADGFMNVGAIHKSLGCSWSFISENLKPLLLGGLIEMQAVKTLRLYQLSPRIEVASMGDLLALTIRGEDGTGIVVIGKHFPRPGGSIAGKTVAEMKLPGLSRPVQRDLPPKA